MGVLIAGAKKKKRGQKKITTSRFGAEGIKETLG